MNNGRNVMTARARASRVIHVVLAGCLAIVASANTHADSPSGYVYTQIDCPGLTNTGLLGINATGATVGNATDSNGNNVAFKYSGGTAGTCTPLPAMPAGFGLYAEDINDSGTIVGIALSPDGSYNEGFILQGSTYTLVPHPPQTFVEIRGINSAGIVAGDAWSTDTAGNTINAVGFIYDPSTGLFKDITVPTATFVIAKGINKAGQVVGNAFFSNQSLSSQGYLCAPNTGANIFCDPNTPGAQTLFTVNGQNTRARGINDQGLIAGFVYGHGLPPAGFVGTSASGYTLLHPPGLGDVYVQGMGNSGEVTGQYYEDTGDTIGHGFIATLAYATPQGSNVPVNAGTVGPATVGLTFPSVTSGGVTTVIQISPSSAGTLPSEYELVGSDIAFDITTTATYTTPPPIIVALQVPAPIVDATTFSQWRVLHNENGVLVDRTASNPPPDYATQTIYASVLSLSPFVIAKAILRAQIQQPINPDGSSVFNINRGVVPVKFTLTSAGVATCQLPSATISLNRTAGTVVGSLDESTYLLASDSGSNFRVSGCQYVYNLATGSLGSGTYQVNISIGGAVVGGGTFALK